MGNLLIRNPHAHPIVLSGCCTLQPGETTVLAVEVAVRYKGAFEIVQNLTAAGPIPRSVNLTSSVDPSTGYGLGGANLLSELIARGYAVHFSGNTTGAPPGLDVAVRQRVEPLPRVGLMRWIPELYTSNTSPIRIGWTMWDTPRLPSWWVPMLNRLDHVIVPSDAQQDIFRDSGVSVPMTSIPEPLNLDDYPYVERKDPDVFTFVSVSRMCSRKAPMELLRCFQAAFQGKNDVRIVFKTLHSQFGMGRLGLPQVDDPRVEIIDSVWPPARVVALLHSADAGVFLSHGEGFFHGCVQAMATGLPTIVPSHSGCSVYADERFNYPIRTVGTEPTDYYVGHMGTKEPFDWWVMDYDQVVETMRHLYHRRAEGRRKGKRAAAWVRKQFGLSQTVDKVEAVLAPFL